jgi:TfoX/Sxy family transcriptional regulator of competence genes
VRILIDPKAVMFLLGTEMDFKTDKLATQFVFNNPNQTSACGCGESVQLTPASDRAAAGNPLKRALRTPITSVSYPRLLGRSRSGACSAARGFMPGPTMFAIAVDGVVYLKADEQSVAAFKREGLAPFNLRSKEEAHRAVLWRMPDRLYDDPDELARWFARGGWRRHKEPPPEKHGCQKASSGKG